MAKLKAPSKHVRLQPHQLATLRRALDNHHSQILCDNCTGMALIRRGLAAWTGYGYYITAAGRARARLKADLPDKSQSQTYGKIPGIWEDLPLSTQHSELSTSAEDKDVRPPHPAK
jgi:hypothetical protein